MGLQDRLFFKRTKASTAPARDPIAASHNIVEDKSDFSHTADVSSDGDHVTTTDKHVSQHVQGGVAKSEAITLTWSKNTLVLVFGL